MKLSELEHMIRYIRNSYGKTMVSDEIMTFLEGQLEKKIPSEAVGWIRDEVLRINDKCPEKLHTAILSCWYEWRRQHPEKCGTAPGDSPRDCKNENCHEGYMTWWYWEPLYRHHTTVNVVCGDCRRSGNTVARAITFEQCLKKGRWIDEQTFEPWEPDSLYAQAKFRLEAEEIVKERRAAEQWEAA